MPHSLLSNGEWAVPSPWSEACLDPPFELPNMTVTCPRGGGNVEMARVVRSIEGEGRVGVKVQKTP